MLDSARHALSRFGTRLENKLAIARCADRTLIGEIRRRKLTYLTERRLACISEACRYAESHALPGLFVEAGCALGGSSILIASIKSSDRALNVYDVFGMIPPPSDEDTPDVHERYKVIVEGKSTGLGGDLYYGYEDDLLAKVRDNFADFDIDVDAQSVHLIKGLLQDTMHIERQVAFAHIDVDWYDPVMAALQRIFPRLVVGGSIVLDDYFDWGGCRKATDEYLRGVADKITTDGSAGSLKVTRIRA